MRFIFSRSAIAGTVTLVTIIVCFLGIRAELNAANYSVREHFFKSSPGDSVAHALVAVGDKRGADLAPP
jgi:hypothetical protein